MANSDNVVRVGLTPKFKDSESLAKILKFECGSVNVLESENKLSLFTYPSSALEFTVSRIILEKQQQLERTCQSIQILLLLSGKARIKWKKGVTEMKRGDVIMIPAVLNSYFINADTDIELFAAAVPGK